MYFVVGCHPVLDLPPQYTQQEVEVTFEIQMEYYNKHSLLYSHSLLTFQVLEDAC